MRNDRYNAVGQELSEIYDWRSKASKTGWLYFTSLFGLNLGAGFFVPLTFEMSLMLGVCSFLAFLVGLILYRLYVEIERLSLHNVVLQEEILRLQEVMVSFVVEEKHRDEAKSIASSPFK
jgi:hypothetical protein